MEQFLELIGEILEMDEDEISMDTDFRNDIEEFTSLMGFEIIVTIEDEYGKVISVPQFLECKTVGDLYAYVK